MSMSFKIPFLLSMLAHIAVMVPLSSRLALSPEMLFSPATQISAAQVQLITLEANSVEPMPPLPVAAAAVEEAGAATEPLVETAPAAGTIETVAVVESDPITIEPVSEHRVTAGTELPPSDHGESSVPDQDTRDWRHFPEPDYIAPVLADSTLAYVNYYKLVNEKLRASIMYPPLFLNGEVTVLFVVRNDGTLDSVTVVEDVSSDKSVLRQTAVQIIRNALPFPPFPADLVRKNVPFTVVIRFQEPG